MGKTQPTSIICYDRNIKNPLTQRLAIFIQQVPMKNDKTSITIDEQHYKFGIEQTNIRE
nr:hypothetical protein [Vibrio aphrogenes]